MSCAKTAEPIEIPFGLWTWVVPRKHLLDGDAHWCLLSNTIESSMCGGDAAFLLNYFDHLFTVQTDKCKTRSCARTDRFNWLEMAVK